MDEGESIHNTVQLSPVTNANQTLDLVDRPIFNVVIIYEDSAAGKRAKHFYDSVIRKLVDECDFSLELWNFQVLAFPDIGKFGRGSRRTGRHRDFLNAAQSSVFRPN